ncbi:MAG TPA: hypothetical protein VJB68_05255 [Methylophilaceae bacterium]|nr:hypothetical protein [Methylophilaceae bacterium]
MARKTSQKYNQPPATKSDLDHLSTELRGEIRDLRTEIEGVDQRVINVENTMATKDQVANVLEIVKSIDEQLKEHKTHPDRIKRLERSVFR